MGVIGKNHLGKRNSEGLAWPSRIGRLGDFSADFALRDWLHYYGFQYGRQCKVGRRSELRHLPRRTSHLKKHHGEVEDCIIFGITSMGGRAILFHALMGNGAIFYRLPISAFIQKGFDPSRVPGRRLDELQLWNCFSYYPSVHRWDILDGQAGKYIGKDKKWHFFKTLLQFSKCHQRAVRDLKALKKRCCSSALSVFL